MNMQLQSRGATVPVRRGYRQACGIARGLDIVGERWALLTVRELLLGPKRFTDLRAGLPGASPNALADRLAELTKAGVIRRRQLPPPAGSWVYELTDWGRQLEPIVLALGTWALGSPARAEQSFVSLDSLMLTIRTYYRPPTDTARTDAPAAAVTIVVRIPSDSGIQSFGIRLDADGALVSHELPDQPDAVITTDVRTLLGVLGDPDRLVRIPKRRMTISGNPDAVYRLSAGVAAPEPEPASARS
jgi:DNA-binding HxlR family transcriptional regulator